MSQFFKGCTASVADHRLWLSRVATSVRFVGGLGGGGLNPPLVENDPHTGD